MLALGLLLLVPVIMWLGQTTLLIAAGLPIQFRISSDILPRKFKRANRAITYGAFALVLILYPLLKGQTPIHYYSSFFPLGRHPLQLLHGLTAGGIYLVLLYLSWIITGNVSFEIRHQPNVIARRLLAAPFTAIIGAGVEELLFRAMLLAGLLESFSTPVAVAIGVMVFAAAHYVRKVKRYWTFTGHLGLGLLLCLSFVLTRSLWLPLGLHAGGILMIMSLRPFIRYQGPPWLVGASIFPYAGIPGVIALVLLSINLYLHYGVAS